MNSDNSTSKRPNKELVNLRPEVLMNQLNSMLVVRVWSRNLNGKMRMISHARLKMKLKDDHPPKKG